MKTEQDFPKGNWPSAVIDPALNEHQDKITFPEKLEQANKVLKMAKLTPNKNCH